MDRQDILQVLVENEAGITAQAVRAEIRGRYGVGGSVKRVLDALMAEGLAAQSEDEDGRRLYAPVMPAAAAALMGVREARRDDESFFG